MTIGYDPYSSQYRALSASAPMATSMIEMLAPLLQSMGMDVMPWLNILRFNRADRPFYEMDNDLSLAMRNQFRGLTSGPPATSNLQSVGRAFAAYFMDDKGLAEASLRRASLGATSYAFGTGGLSMGDLMPGWDRATMGSHNDQLTRYMADIYNFDLPNSVSKGQRQWIAAEMTRANPSLLQNYARMRTIGNELGGDYRMRKDEDWESYNQRIRDTVAKEAENGDLGPWSRLKDVLVQLTDQMAKTQRQMDEFGDAANNWGRVLKTDAQAAMQKVSNMLGGNVYSIFSGDAETVKQIPLSLQHTGALTGRGFDHMRAVSNQARQYLQATGGPVEAAMNVANEAMLQSAGGSQYWMTQEGVDKMFTQYNADLWNTDAGNIARGAAQYYTEYKLRNLKPGQTFNERDTIKEIDAILRSTGGDISVSKVNQALSRATGQRVTLGMGDFQMLGQMTYAKDYMAGQNEFAPMVRQQGQRELVDMIFSAQGSGMTYDRLYQMNDAILGKGRDVLELAQMNGYDLSQQGLNRQQMNFVQNVNRMMQAGTLNMQTSHPEVLGAMGVRSPMEVMRFSSRTAREREDLMRRQRDMRTYLSSMVNGGDMFRSMYNFMRDNPDANIGQIMAAGGTADLDGKSLDALANMKMDRENTQEFANTLRKLGNRTNPSQDRAYFHHLMDEANKAIRDGDMQGAADILSPLGISYNARTGSFETEEFNQKAFTDARNAWGQENRRKLRNREQIVKRFAPKGVISDMSFGDKKDAAEHIVAWEIAEEKVRKGEDPEGKYKDYLNVVRNNDTRLIGKVYASIKDDLVKTRDYDARKEKVEEEMGISHDKSDIGAVVANILHEVGRTFMSKFVSTADGAIRVTEVSAQ